MRDAIGGVVNLVIIVVFLVIVSGYLAFNVNYTKAFRVKNKIITTYEQYEGNCKSETSNCKNIIREYMRRLGYDNNNGIKCKDNSGNTQNLGYCAEEVAVQTEGINGKKESTKYYYRVTTQISIDIPIIKNIMSNNTVFQITGDTKTFTRSNFK